MIRDNLKRLIKVKEVAQLLNLSIRQVYRLRNKVKKEGIKGVIHHLKGKTSLKKTPKKIEEKIKRLYQERYSGFNLNHFTEYLNEKENITISREKVRQILRQDNLYLKKPKRQPKHRIHREPMPQEGLMSQLDTSLTSVVGLFR